MGDLVVECQVSQESGHSLMPVGNFHHESEDTARLSSALLRATDAPLWRALTTEFPTVSGDAAHAVCFGPCPRQVEPFGLEDSRKWGALLASVRL
jgi:hypothetical protein